MQPLHIDLFQNELLYLSMNINYASIQFVMRSTSGIRCFGSRAQRGFRSRFYMHLFGLSHDV